MSQARYHGADKLPKETHADYEARTWEQKAHVDAKTKQLFIPPMAIKKALDASAKFTSKQIPGKGKATYTKHIKSGVLVAEPIMLNLTLSDVVCRKQMVDSTGGKGSAGGTRVERWFPDIIEWEGTAEFLIFDDTVTKDVFVDALEEAGRFIGIGVFRPENGGFYGRFEVVSVDWI